MKFRRSNSGIFYLIVIGLGLAMAGGAFREDEGILLAPIALVTLAIITTMLAKRQWFLRSRNRVQ